MTQSPTPQSQDAEREAPSEDDVRLAKMTAFVTEVAIGAYREMLSGWTAGNAAPGDFSEDMAALATPAPVPASPVSTAAPKAVAGESSDEVQCTCGIVWGHTDRHGWEIVDMPTASTPVNAAPAGEPELWQRPDPDYPGAWEYSRVKRDPMFWQPLYTAPAASLRDAEDAARYRELRDEVKQLKRDRPLGIAVAVIDDKRNSSGNFNVKCWAVTYGSDADAAIDAQRLGREKDGAK